MPGTHTLAITFLSPLAGIVAAAIGLPLLLLLYFLRLRRRPVRISSTLLWQASAKDVQVNAPWRMLRLSLLLFLHLVALACLAAALARPALRATGETPDRLVLLVDRSASMSAMDGRGDGDDATVSRLGEARQAAIRIVEDLPAQTEAMVMSFAGGAETLINFTRNRGALRSAIEGIGPTDLPGDLAAALRVVRAFTTSGTEEGERLRTGVVLLSDGSFASGGADAIGAGVEEGAFRFVRVGPAPDAPRFNVGIVSLASRRDIEDPALVRVFARVLGTGGVGGEVTLACEVGGETIGTSRVELNDPGDGASDLAEGSATFEFELTEPGPVVVSIAGDGGVLSSDDSAGVVLSGVRGPRILLVQPEEEGGLAEQLLFDALDALDPELLRVVGGAEYERVGARGFDLVVFDGVRPEETPPVPSLSFGAGVPMPGLLVEEREGERGESRVLFWKRTHPALRYVSLAETRIGESKRIRLPDEESGTESDVLATGAGGPLIVEVSREGTRRLIVGFRLRHSLWWREPGFPIFISNAVAYLSGRSPEAAGRLVRAGEPVTVRVAPGAGSVRVSGPVEMERSVPAGAERVALGVLPRVGLYEVEGAAAEDRLIAVNLMNEVESAIRTESSVEVGGRTAAGEGASRTLRREIWHYFVAGALLVLLIEWFIYAWKMRIR